MAKTTTAQVLEVATAVNRLDLTGRTHIYRMLEKEMRETRPVVDKKKKKATEYPPGAEA